MCSSTFGPAIAPSFVTCPIRNTLTPLPLASCISRSVHSRSWLTLPGDDSTSALWTLWIESITTTVGLRRLDRLDDGAQVGLAREQQIVCAQAEPPRPQPDLRQRLLARDVEDRAVPLGHAVARPARAGCTCRRRIAADQHQRARHDPAAEHPVELVDADRAAGRSRPRRSRQSAARARYAGRRHGAGRARDAAAVGAAVRPALRGCSRPRSSGQRPIQRVAFAPHALQTYSVLAFGIEGCPTLASHVSLRKREAERLYSRTVASLAPYASWLAVGFDDCSDSSGGRGWLRLGSGSARSFDSSTISPSRASATT